MKGVGVAPGPPEAADDDPPRPHSHAERLIVCVLYAFVVVVRLANGLVLLGLALCHFALDAFVVDGSRVFNLFLPRLTGSLMALLALAHLWPVLALLASRLRPAARRRLSTRRPWPLVAWLEARFGIRGRYFEHLLVGAEAAEAAAQTVNLAALAPSGIAAANVRSFAGILAASCVASPLLMLSDNVVVYTDAVVLLDATFDFALSIAWPLSYLVPWLVMLFRCDGALADWHDALQGRALLRTLLAESPIELLARIMPFFQAHILLLELERILRKENRDVFLNKHAVAPAAAVERQRAELRRRRSPRWVRLLVLAAGAGYAAAVLGVTLSATRADRCDAQPMCQRQGYPLFSTDCSCVLVDAGHGSDFEEAEFDRTVRANADSLQVVSIDGCGLAELPAALRETELPELFVLEANDNALETAEGLDRQPGLLHVNLRGNRLAHVPRFHADGGVLVVFLGQNPIRALRTDTGDLRGLITLELMDAALDSGEIPCEYGQLPIVHLFVTNSSVSSLPAGCLGEWERSLDTLALNHNNLTAALPFDVSGVAKLALGGNPLCAGSTAGSCELPCASTCMPWELGDAMCDEFRCGVEACDFDRESCSDAFVREHCSV